MPSLQWERNEGEWQLCEGDTVHGWITFSPLKPDGYQYWAWMSARGQTVCMGYHATLAEAKKSLMAYVRSRA